MAGVAFLAGSIIAGTIVHKLGVYKTSLAGVFLIMSSGMLLLIVYWLDGLSLWGFFGPSMLATFGCALTAGSGASGAMEPFGEFSGVASAMFGALQLGGSAIVGSLAALFALSASCPLAITMLATSLISLFLLLLLHLSSSRRSAS